MIETSAGAIVYTRIGDETYYLITKDFHGNCGFPKGHLEKDETPEQAAKREIREEAGVDVMIDTGFQRKLVYPLANGNTKHSIYFTAYYQDQLPQRQVEEVEKIFLLPYKEALETLTFDSMKEVFKEAVIYLKGKAHE